MMRGWELKGILFLFFAVFLSFSLLAHSSYAIIEGCCCRGDALAVEYTSQDSCRGASEQFFPDINSIYTETARSLRMAEDDYCQVQVCNYNYKCNNNVLDTADSEICDYVNGVETFTTGNNYCASFPGYINGQISCTSGCSIDFSNCQPRCLEPNFCAVSEPLNAEAIPGTYLLNVGGGTNVPLYYCGSGTCYACTPGFVLSDGICVPDADAGYTCDFSQGQFCSQIPQTARGLSGTGASEVVGGTCPSSLTCYSCDGTGKVWNPSLNSCVEPSMCQGAGCTPVCPFGQVWENNACVPETSQNSCTSQPGCLPGTPDASENLELRPSKLCQDFSESCYSCASGATWDPQSGTCVQGTCQGPTDNTIYAGCFDQGALPSNSQQSASTACGAGKACAVCSAGYVWSSSAGECAPFTPPQTSSCTPGTCTTSFMYCNALGQEVQDCRGLNPTDPVDDCGCAAGSCQADGTCAVGQFVFFITVKDRALVPLAGARVGVSTPDGHFIRYITDSQGKVNHNGQFRTRAFPIGSQYTIYSEKQGYIKATKTLTPTADETVLMVLDAMPRGTISGTVLGAAPGVPSGESVFLQGVSVLLHGIGGTFTATVGEYSFANIFQGEYVITADGSPKGYASERKRVTLAGNALDVDFLLQPSSCFPEPTVPVRNIGVSAVKGQPKARILWNSTCQPEKFSVYRCISNPGTNECMPSQQYEPIAQISLPAQQTAQNEYIYTDEIEQGKTYCYNVSAYFPWIAGKEYFGSKVACIQAPMDEKCIQGYNSFCMAPHTSPEKMLCTEKNTAVTAPPGISCKTSETCRQSGLDAECTASVDCSKCNGLLGMFGIFGETTVRPGPLPVFISVGCSDAQIRKCYLDYTATTTDKYIDCSNVDSCYDYRSEGACTSDSDRCGVGGDSGCEWLDSPQYNELGVGVCRPAEEAAQDCSKCNSRSGAFDSCTEELCLLHGSSSCYFNEIDLFPDIVGVDDAGCMNARDVSCSEYDTYDTAGGGGDCAGTPPVSAGLDSSNNALAQRSGDKLGFGTCRYDPSRQSFDFRCFKDYNADGTGDTFAYITDWTIPSQVSYSFGLEEDNTPPVTTIAHPPENAPISPENLRFMYSTDEEVKATKYKVVPAGTNPSSVLFKDASPTAIGSPADIDSRLQNDLHTIFYYSEDLAGNLEVVKSFTFLADSSFEVRLSQQHHAYLDADGVWKTDTTLSITNEKSELMRCTAELKLSGNTVDSGSDIIEETAASFTSTYFGLHDGTYAYEVDCRDKAGNNFAQDFTISLTADHSVRNIVPQGKLNVSSVTLSATTARQGTCKYSETYFPGSFPSMQPLTRSGAGPYTHTVQLSSLEEGRHVYYIFCKFQDSLYGDSFIHNPSMKADFSVDTSPPATALYGLTITPSSPYDNSWKKPQQPLMRFMCDDTGSGAFSTEKVFGCFGNPARKYLYYCIGYGCDFSQDSIVAVTYIQNGIGQYDYVFGKQGNTEEFLLDPTYLSFYSRDGGGNSGQLIEGSNKNVLLKIDGQPPIIDNFSFGSNGDVVQLAGNYFMVHDSIKVTASISNYVVATSDGLAVDQVKSRLPRIDLENFILQASLQFPEALPSSTVILNISSDTGQNFILQAFKDADGQYKVRFVSSPESTETYFPIGAVREHNLKVVKDGRLVADGYSLSIGLYAASLPSGSAKKSRVYFPKHQYLRSLSVRDNDGTLASQISSISLTCASPCIATNTIPLLTSPQSSPEWELTALGQGATKVNLTVADEAGNTASKQFELYHDTVPPNINSVRVWNHNNVEILHGDLPPKHVNANRNFRIEVNANDSMWTNNVTRVSYSIGGTLQGELARKATPKNTWSATINMTLSQMGETQVEITATDALGNAATRSMMIYVWDTTVPSIIGSDSYSKSPNPTITINTSRNSTCTIKPNASSLTVPYEPMSTLNGFMHNYTFSYSATIREGVMYRINCTDVLGNTNSSEQKLYLFLDPLTLEVTRSSGTLSPNGEILVTGFDNGLFAPSFTIRENVATQRRKISCTYSASSTAPSQKGVFGLASYHQTQAYQPQVNRNGATAYLVTCKDLAGNAATSYFRIRSMLPSGFYLRGIEEKSDGIHLKTTTLGDCYANNNFQRAISHVYETELLAQKAEQVICYDRSRSVNWEQTLPSSNLSKEEEMLMAIQNEGYFEPGLAIFTKEQSPAIRVSTAREATCTFTDFLPAGALTATTSGTLHSRTYVHDYLPTYTVIACSEGSVSETTAVKLIYDSSPPEMTFSLTNPRNYLEASSGNSMNYTLYDGTETEIRVQSTEEIKCRFDEANVGYELMQNEMPGMLSSPKTSPISLPDETSGKVFVACKDLAGNPASAEAYGIALTMNHSTPIKILAALLDSTEISDGSVVHTRNLVPELSVMTDRAESCEYVDNGWNEWQRFYYILGGLNRMGLIEGSQHSFTHGFELSASNQKTFTITCNYPGLASRPLTFTMVPDNATFVQIRQINGMPARQGIVKVNSSILSVSGIAEVGSALTVSVLYEFLSQSQQPITVQPPDGNFTNNVVTLMPGLNNITVSVIDPAGNSAWTSALVNFTPIGPSIAAIKIAFNGDDEEGSSHQIAPLESLTTPTFAAANLTNISVRITGSRDQLSMIDVSNSQFLLTRISNGVHIPVGFTSQTLEAGTGTIAVLLQLNAPIQGQVSNISLIVVPRMPLENFSATASLAGSADIRLHPGIPLINIKPILVVTNAPLNLTFNGTVTLNPSVVYLEIMNRSGSKTLQKSIAVSGGTFAYRILSSGQVSEGLNTYTLTAEKFGNRSIPVQGAFYVYTKPSAITNVSIQ